MRRTCYRQHSPQQAFGQREKHGNQRTIQEVSSSLHTSCIYIIHHYIFQQLSPKESSHKFEVSPIYLKETGDMLSWSPPSSNPYQCKSSCADGKNICPVLCLLGWSVLNSLALLCEPVIQHEPSLTRIQWKSAVFRREIYCPYHFTLVLVHAEVNSLWKKQNHVH